MLRYQVKDWNVAVDCVLLCENRKAACGCR